MQGVIEGISVVTCVYTNSATDQFGIIDFRIYETDGNVKTKLDQWHNMLMNCACQKQLQFYIVLMDSWYATNDVMLITEKLKKVYCRPIKDNRLMSVSSDAHAYGRVDASKRSEPEKQRVKI